MASLPQECLREPGSRRIGKADCINTRKCRFIQSGRGCRNGTACKFAHEESDLRRHPSRGAAFPSDAISQFMPFHEDSAVPESAEMFLTLDLSPSYKDRKRPSTVSSAASETTTMRTSSGSESPYGLQRGLSTESVSVPAFGRTEDAGAAAGATPHLPCWSPPRRAATSLLQPTDLQPSPPPTPPGVFAPVRRSIPVAQYARDSPAFAAPAQVGAQPLGAPGGSGRELYRSRGDQTLLNIRASGPPTPPVGRRAAAKAPPPPRPPPPTLLPCAASQHATPPRRETQIAYALWSASLGSKPAPDNLLFDTLLEALKPSLAEFSDSPLPDGTSSVQRLEQMLWDAKPEVYED